MSSFTRKPKYYMPGIGGSLLIILIMITLGTILAVIASVAYTALSGGFAEVSPDDIAQALAGNLSVIYFAQMAAPIIFIWAAGHYNSKNPLVAPVEINSPHIGKFNILTLGIVLLVLTVAVGWVLEPVCNLFPVPESFKIMFRNIGKNFWDTVISVAVMAPLFEEFILRGTIERGMLTRKSATYAILWSSFLFAAIHMNLWQAIPAFAIGCLLGWVYYRTHSIWATIFMHFVNNFSSVLMFWIFPQLDPDASSMENMRNLTGSADWYWVLVGLGTVLTVGCIILLNKYLPRNPQSFKPKDLLLANEPAQMQETTSNS